MALSDLTSRSAVLAAMYEFDRLGRDTFLERHGFGRARDYFVIHEGRSYDSKAIVGVAHERQTGSILEAGDFSGGEQTVAPLLEGLGFIVEIRSSHRPGIWRDGARTVRVAKAEAVAEWADVAFTVLQEVAATYGAVIYYQDLADRVQDQTGVRTSMLLMNWIGSVLDTVLHRAVSDGKPPLTALVVRSTDGGVGDGYDQSLLLNRGRPSSSPEERERLAAEDRLTCYQFYASDVPRDARPQLTAQLQRRRQRAQSTSERPAPATCQTCYMQLPLSGRCDSCG